MGVRAAIAGASGYAGGELLRLLLDHPDIEPVVLAAGSQAGTYVTDVHPHLPALAGERFVATTREALSAADVVFLALPHGESAAIARKLDVPLVVDLGSDHRHAAGWTYGLVEADRAAVAAATRIAVPGCYPTAVSLALLPLLHGVLVAGDDVVVVAASGYSGGGRGASTLPGLSAYKVAAHQHTPEIATTLGLDHLSFTTVLAPMPRGILATCTARTAATAGELRGALAAAYGAEPFVHVLPEGQWPHTVSTTGSNACLLQVAVDPNAGRAVVVSAIDNLGKGAAGQAIQCANVALGLSETAGLTTHGVAP